MLYLKPKSIKDLREAPVSEAALEIFIGHSYSDLAFVDRLDGEALGEANTPFLERA